MGSLHQARKPPYALKSALGGQLSNESLRFFGEAWNAVLEDMLGGSGEVETRHRVAVELGLMLRRLRVQAGLVTKEKKKTSPRRRTCPAVSSSMPATASR